MTIYTSILFSFSIYVFFFINVSTSCVVLEPFSNSYAMDASSSSAMKWKSYSSPENKEIPQFEVVSMVSDIILKQLEVLIALQEIHHKLDLLMSQVEEVAELLRSVIRCI